MELYLRAGQEWKQINHFDPKFSIVMMLIVRDMLGLPFQDFSWMTADEAEGPDH
jgi:hypothetical protein